MSLLDLFRRRNPREKDAAFLAASDFFDARWYLRAYPDVAAAGYPPAMHYVTHGAREGRDPGPRFSTSAYLERYPDVAASGLNPLIHYLRFGAPENRVIDPARPTAASIDPERDREANIANARANRAAVEASERALDALRARLPDPRDHGPPGEVPRMFHFVWLSDQPQGDIPYYAAIAIRSARHFNPGWAAFYYCNHEPEGPNWDRVKPDVTVVRLDDFRFFRNAELHHYAHKADVIRLIVINQCGGVYLDLDTITRKSFEDLRTNTFCMGVQADCHGVGSGLCNAVLVGQPGAQFSTRWLEQYDYFRSRGKDLLWDYHSVKLPALMMAKTPELITVLDYRAFFYPLWNVIEQQLFSDAGARFKEDFEVAYCHHLWNAGSDGLLASIDQHWISTSGSIYAGIVREVEGLPA